MLDGTECVGKTTLAKKLTEKLKIPLYSHFKFEKKNDWNNCSDIMGRTEYELLKHIDFLKNTLVIDRLYLSNLVYTDFYNRKFDNSYQQKGLDNSILFYITANNQVLTKRYTERGDEFVPLLDVIKLSKLFENYYHKFHCEKRQIDTSLDNIDTTVHKILKQLSEYSLQLASTQNTGNNVTKELFLYDVNVNKLETDMLDYYKTIDFNIADFLSKEQKYYDEFFQNLENNIKHALDTDSNGLRSRRFIHSDNGCLSLIHILAYPSDYYNVNIYMRSSNTKTLFYADFYSIYTRLENILKKYLFFKSDSIINMTITFGNSHIIP